MNTRKPCTTKVPALFLGAAAIVSTAHASTDYGPAIWKALPNYYTSGYGHRFLVIHDMEGYYANVWSTFNANGTSVHYAVNSKQDSGTDAPAGEISQFVRESNYAWDARCWNKYHAGTEHEGFASNPAWYTETMYQASAALQRHLCDTYGIPKDRNHIVGHGEKSNSAWVSWANANIFNLGNGDSATCNTHTDPGPYWDWSHFMDLVNTTTPSSNLIGPDAVSRSASRIDAVVRGGNNNIYQKYWDGSAWAPFVNLGGTSLSGPAICAWGLDRLDVFCRGSDNSLQHKFFNGAWSAWTSEGGVLSSGPDAVSWGTNHIAVAVRGGGNSIYVKQFNNGTWTSFVNIGGTSASDPSICSWGTGRLDVFYNNNVSGGHLIHTWYSGGAWAGVWEDLGAPTGGITSGPDAVCWGPNRIDVVARADVSAKKVFHKYYNGTSWSVWEDLGDPGATSDPGISSRDSGRLDVWVRGSSNSLHHKWYDSNGWSAWEDMGGILQ